MMDNKIEANLVEGPIGRTLLRLTSPMVLGMFSIMSLNLVDTFFVAQLGTDELAAITFTFPIVMIMMNLAFGLSIGTGSVISRAIGGGDQFKIKRLTTDSIFLGVIIMFGLALIGISTIDQFFTIMHAPNHLIPLIKSYIKIWYIGLPILVIPMIGNTAINASGDMKIPGLIMCLAALINLALDPLLIFGLLGFPRLEIEGAALATVISYTVALVFSISFLCLKKKMLTYRLRLREMIISWKEMLRVGIPAAGTQVMIPISNAMTLWMLAHFGTSVVAAYGIVSRLETFSLVVILGLCSSLGAFAGQNWGANNHNRITQALKVSYLFSICWGIVLAVLFGLGSKAIPKFFNGDLITVETVSRYLLIVPISYGAQGCIFVANSFFNAIGKPLSASLITISRHFFLYLPSAYIAMQFFGPPGIFTMMTVVNILAGGAVCIWTLKKIMLFRHCS